MAESRTKVLMFGWEFPPHNSGGLGVACFGLTKALIDSGIDVSFVLPKRVNFNKTHCPIVFADNSTNLSIHEFDSVITPYITSAEYEALASGGRYANNLLKEVFRYSKFAKDIALDEVYDVIHAHDWLSFPAAIEAKKISGKPMVAHVHATEFDRTGGHGIDKAVYNIEKEGMMRADKVVAVSDFTKKTIVKEYGIPAKKITVVHNGIDEADFIRGSASTPSILKLKEQGNKIVIFVGRITLQKGPDYFVEVAQKVLERYPKVIFIVSGSGDMEYKMIRDVAYRKIADHFIFTGFLRGEELNKIYAEADLFIMPSVSEPFGITPLESMLAGTPVLISKQSGVSEVVSHALKADFWDVYDMTDKVLSVLQNDSLKNSLAEGALGEVKKIDWKKAASKCIDLYRSL